MKFIIEDIQKRAGILLTLPGIAIFKENEAFFF